MTRFEHAALAIIGVILSGGLVLSGEPEYLKAKSEALELWRQGRFGMFVHWGPVSLTGKEIGWSRQGPRRGRARAGTGTTPMDVYDNLYKEFNPVKFDAGQWVAVARAAGMKYLVFTSKHHDGFSCFDSKCTDYRITNPASPYGKDICQQIAKACNEGGLRVGWYYSPRDWYHPDFATDRHDRYLRFYLDQLRELCTNYGRVDILWFDGFDSPLELWGNTAEASFKMLRQLQPDIILNNRGGLPGDFDTPEQRVGGFNRQRPWETCMTICRQWAWKPDDTMKSLRQCLHTLIQTAGGDGNLLLNVGPMPDGRIEPRQVERLKEMGAWLEHYGDGIYGTRGGPIKPGRWGASTCQADRIFLFLFKTPPDGVLQLPPFPMKITGARSLTSDNVDVKQNDDGVHVRPAAGEAFDIAAVIELTVDGNAFDIEPVVLPAERSGSLAYSKQTTASNVFSRQHSRYGPHQALDDDPDTRWATDAGTHAAWLEVDLASSTTISRVMIDEREWDRVQKFELLYRTAAGEDWNIALTGTRIGAEYTSRFPAVIARHVRLNILEATEGPTLWEFQLFGSE